MPTGSIRIAIRQGVTWTVDDSNTIDFTTEAGWETAINIFEARIRGRFFDVIESIQTKEGSGFAVMALESLLIETLQQFFERVEETPYQQSGKYFRRFLTMTDFKTFFNSPTADIFYRKIRCGILHMAEIKGDSRITTRDADPLVALVGKDSLVINRRKFHETMEIVFQKCIDQLKKNDPPDNELRRCFKHKMDFICRMPAEAGATTP